MSIKHSKMLEELKLQGKYLKKMERKLLKRQQKAIKKFKFHHKALFAATVFLGLVFLWYGVWSIIDVTPILHNPYVALVLGLVLLLGTGMYYDNTSK